LQLHTDVILLGHGSRRNSATDVGLAEVVRRMQRRVSPSIRVRLAGFEFTRPSLAEAVAESARDGADRAVVVPYFLFSGREVRVKIPAELEELRHEHPSLELRYAECLGPDARMAEVAADRVRETLAGESWRRATNDVGALAGSNGVASRLGVVVVSRGSRSAEADAGLRQVTSMVGARLGSYASTHAQAEIGEPRLPSAVTTALGMGATAIVVQPYLIFPGSVLLDTVKPALETAQAEHPGVPMALTRILGVDDRMIDLALVRAVEAGLPLEAVTAPTPS